jgi:hypothetical protein
VGDEDGMTSGARTTELSDFASVGILLQRYLTKTIILRTRKPGILRGYFAVQFVERN